MFDRFTEAAQRTITLASEAARRDRALELSSRHLLLGTLLVGGAAAEILRAHAVTPETLRPLVRDYTAPDGWLGMTSADAEALRGLGIDLDQVAAAVRDNFDGTPPTPRVRRRRRLFGGRGDAIPVSDQAKRAIEGAAQVPAGPGNKGLTDLHLLAGLLSPGQREAPDLLRACGADPDGVRRAVTARLRDAA